MRYSESYPSFSWETTAAEVENKPTKKKVFCFLKRHWIVNKVQEWTTAKQEKGHTIKDHRRLGYKKNILVYIVFFFLAKILVYIVEMLTKVVP